VLRQSIVHRHHGKLQCAVLCHRLQANDAGGSLFGATNHGVNQAGARLVNGADQVATVIHDDIGLVVEYRVQMLEIRLVVFAFDSEYRNLVLSHQSGGNIILGAKGVASTQHDICATRLQSQH